jgi:hypothetical protein
MNKPILILFLLIILPLCSAEIQSLPHPVKVESCVNLPQSYANSTWQNITTIQQPDETITVLNTEMQSLGGGYYNFTYCNTTQNGEYIVNGIGDIDGTAVIWNYKFTVNPLGKIFTNQQAILYFIVFLISFILFVLCAVFGISAPSGNNRDAMTGYIFAVSNMKYVKIFLLALSYLLLMLIVYFGYIISYGYLDLDFLGNLFYFAFYVMVIATFPLFIIGVYVVIANAIRDSKVSEMLQRGLTVR